MFDRLRVFWKKGATDGNAAAPVAEFGKVTQADTAASNGWKERGDACLDNGDAAAAAEFYEKAIGIDPGNVPALLKAGFCLRESGRELEAEQLIRRTLALAPESSDAHYMLSTVVRARGDSSQAIDELFAALQCEPQFEIAYYELCFLLFQSGRIVEARQAAQAGLERFPESADLHFCLGNIFLAENQWEPAVANFRQVLSLAPDHALACVNLSLALQELGRHDEALEAIDRALAIAPAVADWHLKRGYVLQMQSRFESAGDAYRSAIALQPDLAKAYANLGSVLEQGGQLDGAVANYRKAVELAPQDPDLLFNLGAGLQAKRQFDEAVTCYRGVLRLDPDHLKTLHNMPSVLVWLDKPDEALAFYDAVFERYPNLAQARMNHAYLLLQQGRFREGWALMEYRWQCADAPPRPSFSAPNWLGNEDVRGKTILIHGEQGFGDMLHFLRYTKLVAEMGATVYLQLPSALKSLAETCPGVTTVFAEGEELPPVDFVCAILSLPLACKTEVSTIPNEVPYLRGDPQKIVGWNQLLGEKKTLRVGLAWAGDPRPSQPMAAAMDKVRSMHFDRLLPLLDVAGVSFFSLQIGEAARLQMNQHPKVTDYTPQLCNFQDTANLIEALDLVITVDTSIVHLAGALAKPVWLMDRFGHCYRWFAKREDSPWYPTLRIFRQEAPGDWDGVVARIRRELESLAASSHAPIADVTDIIT